MLSIFLGGAVERENWRAFFILVGSISILLVSLKSLEREYIAILFRRSDEDGGASIHSSRLRVFGFAAS